MSVLYLICSVIGSAALSVMGGYYNRRHDHRGAGALYNFLQIATAFVLWAILFALNPSFDPAVLLYSALFGICYAASMIGIINAIKSGSVALTSLMVQFSIIAATVWGFLFWDTPVTATAVIGLVLVILSLCLCFLKKKAPGDHKKLSLSWVGFAALAFVGNAGCTIIQKTEQMVFDGKHGELLMTGALLLSTLFCFILFMRSDRSAAAAICKKSWYLPVLAGGCNMVLNLCVILLATSSLSPAVIYPVISVGGLAVTMLFSLFVFREKLTKLQWLGILIGAVAVAVLSM